MSITKTDLDKLRRIVNGAMMSHLDRQDAKGIMDRIEADQPRPFPSMAEIKAKHLGCMVEEAQKTIPTPTENDSGKAVIENKAGNIVGMQG